MSDTFIYIWENGRMVPDDELQAQVEREAQVPEEDWSLPRFGYRIILEEDGGWQTVTIVVGRATACEQLLPSRFEFAAQLVIDDAIDLVFIYDHHGLGEFLKFAAELRASATVFDPDDRREPLQAIGDDAEMTIFGHNGEQLADGHHWREAPDGSGLTRDTYRKMNGIIRERENEFIPWSAVGLVRVRKFNRQPVAVSP